MDCQKKSEQVIEQMKNFALGNISAKLELELLAHVTECEACREAYDHAKAMRSAVDHGLESLVAGEPSPQFAARLRARIAAEPAPKRWAWDAWRVWEHASRQTLSYALGTLVLATLLIVVRMGLPRKHVSAPAVAEVTSTISPSPSVATDSPGTSAIPVHSREKLAFGSVPSPRIQREPEVLVPKEEFLAVVRFYEAVHGTPVHGDQLYAAQQEPQKPLELKPIEITPLEPLETPAVDSHQGPGLF
jgi:hypothetical protein